MAPASSIFLVVAPMVTLVLLSMIQPRQESKLTLPSMKKIAKNLMKNVDLDIDALIVVVSAGWWKGTLERRIWMRTNVLHMPKMKR